MNALHKLPKSLLSTLVFVANHRGPVTYKILRFNLGLTVSGAKLRIRAAKRAGLLVSKRDGQGPGHIAHFVLTPKAKEMLP